MSKLKVDAVTDIQTVIRDANGEPLLSFVRVGNSQAARDAEMQALAAFEGYLGVNYVDRSSTNVVSIIFNHPAQAKKFYDFMGGQ